MCSRVHVWRVYVLCGCVFVVAGVLVIFNRLHDCSASPCFCWLAVADAGAEVLSIDSVNAVDSLANFANSNVGLSADASIRFSYTVTSAYSTRNLQTSPLPLSATVNYTVVLQGGGEPTSVAIPWVFYVTASTSLAGKALRDTPLVRMRSACGRRHGAQHGVRVHPAIVGSHLGRA